VAQAIGDAPAATTSPLAALGGVGQPFGDAAAPGTGIVPVGAHSLADGIGTAGSGNETINSLPHELGSALAASTHPAAEGTAHVGAVIAGGMDGSAAIAASAAVSGGLHLSVPPLDPTYLRYVGLAGLMGLMIQSATRWAEAAGGCGFVPKPVLSSEIMLTALTYILRARLEQSKPSQRDERVEEVVC